MINIKSVLIIIFINVNKHIRHCLLGQHFYASHKSRMKLAARNFRLEILQLLSGVHSTSRYHRRLSLFDLLKDSGPLNILFKPPLPPLPHPPRMNITEIWYRSVYGEQQYLSGFIHWQ